MKTTIITLLITSLLLPSLTSLPTTPSQPSNQSFILIQGQEHKVFKAPHIKSRTLGSLKSTNQIIKIIDDYKWYKIKFYNDNNVPEIGFIPKSHIIVKTC